MHKIFEENLKEVQHTSRREVCIMTFSGCPAMLTSSIKFITTKFLKYSLPPRKEKIQCHQFIVNFWEMSPGCPNNILKWLLCGDSLGTSLGLKFRNCITKHIMSYLFIFFNLTCEINLLAYEMCCMKYWKIIYCILLQF